MAHSDERCLHSLLSPTQISLLCNNIPEQYKLSSKFFLLVFVVATFLKNYKPYYLCSPVSLFSNREYDSHLLNIRLVPNSMLSPLLISRNPHNNSIREIAQLCLFYGWGKLRIDESKSRAQGCVLSRWQHQCWNPVPRLIDPKFTTTCYPAPFLLQFLFKSNTALKNILM